MLALLGKEGFRDDRYVQDRVEGSGVRTIP